MGSCVIYLRIRQYLKEKKREIGSTTRSPQINLELHLLRRIVNNIQYRFLWLCWFAKLVGLPQLSFPCYFFGVYLNVKTCKRFSFSLARAGVCFLFNISWLFCVLYFISQLSFFGGSPSVPTPMVSPLFFAAYGIIYVNVWLLPLFKTQRFSFHQFQYLNAILLSKFSNVSFLFPKKIIGQFSTK